jgi:hypothetical protein
MLYHPENRSGVEWWKAMVERWNTMILPCTNENSLKPDELHPEASDGKKGFAAWLVEISRSTAPRMNDSRISKELMDELLDEETGLPM